MVCKSRQIQCPPNFHRILHRQLLVNDQHLRWLTGEPGTGGHDPTESRHSARPANKSQDIYISTPPPRLESLCFQQSRLASALEEEAALLGHPGKHSRLSSSHTPMVQSSMPGMEGKQIGGWVVGWVKVCARTTPSASSSVSTSTSTEPCMRCASFFFPGRRRGGHQLPPPSSSQPVSTSTAEWRPLATVGDRWRVATEHCELEREL